MSRLAVRWGMVLGLVVVLASAGHARAAGEAAVRVSIRPVTTVVIGTAPTVVVDLHVGGAALGDEPVELSIDGTYYRRLRTAAGGSVSFTLPKDLVAGTHRLTAVYPGRTNAYLPASASATFEVAPYELTVQTVPALPGMGFTLDGEPFEADAAGVASIPVDTAGDHVLVALASDYHVGGRQAQFARWSVNDEYASQVTVSVPKDGVVQAGFDVYQLASQVFVDPSGGPVEPDRITSFTVRSSLGQVLTFPDGNERVYKASRVVRRSSGLESVDIRYNVTDVQVDGSNVVNAGQQQFYVTSNATWRISLLLFSARIQPKDALFGFTAGTSVEVIYPSGKSEVVKAGDDGIVVIPWLARGIYRVVVADAPGWAPAMPVALSRDQEVELRVVSYLDMGLAVVIALGVIFGLLHRGRPHLIPNTVRAVGGGVTGRLPVPAAVRPAVKPVQATAASPPEPAAAATSTAEHKAPVKVEVAPILATIARRTDLDELSKAPLTPGRQAPSAEPVMDALAQFAPALLGLPQEKASQGVSSEAAPSGRGKDATATTAKDVADKPAPRRRASRRTAASVDGVAADAKGADAKGADANAAAAETVPSVEGAAAASTAKRRSKKTAASSGDAAAERPRKARGSASDESPESSKSTKPKRSRSRTSAKMTEAASSPAADVAEKPKRSRRRTKAEPDAAAAEADVAPKKRRSARASTTRKKDDAAASEQTASADSKASTTKTATRRTRATEAKAKATEAADDTPVKKARGTRSASRTSSAKTASAKTAKPKAGTAAAKRTRTTRSAKPAAKPAAAAAAAQHAQDASAVTARPTTGRIFRSTARASDSRGVQVNRLGIADPGRSPIDVPKKPGDEAPPVMQACANCGLELWVGARFCRRCGQPTAGMPTEAGTEVPPSNANGRTPRRGGRRAADPALAAPPPSRTSRTRSSQRGGE